MALKLLNGPAVEPVTVAEAKAHLRLDTTAEDALISSLITTARLQIEAALGLALNTQQWMWLGDCWPLNGLVELPLRPVFAIDAIRIRDSDGNATVLDPITYVLDTASEVARISSRTGYWPTPGARFNGIEIDFSTGYGTVPANVPSDIRQALLLLIAHWFEHRDPSEVGADTSRVPAPVSALLQPYTRARV